MPETIKDEKGRMLFRFVSKAEASSSPYPFVFVNEDETIRELHSTEREYMETAFYPGDGNLPHPKKTLQEKNGWGEIRGVCFRSAVPVNCVVLPAPATDPTPAPMTKEQLIAFHKEKGFSVREMPDGTVLVTRKKKWWKFW